MAAENKEFPWMSYYGHYEFFEQRMELHTKVNCIKKVNNSLYDIQRLDGTTIRTFVCECYSFDVAEYIECCQELEELNAIVINSNWCGYTSIVKKYCMEREVGVYDISGFMAAINLPKYWEYLTEDERKNFRQRNWI